MGVYMQSASKKRIISGAVVGLIIVLLVVGLVLAGHHKQKAKPNSGQFVDSFSHQTVSNPSGKSPDRFGVQANTPVYLGFDKLLNYGLGYGQLAGLKSAFYKYSLSLPKPLNLISIDVDNINTQHDSHSANSPFDIIFRVQFDEKNIYQAKAEYSGLSDIRLYLSDPSGEQVFDSGVISPAE